MTVLTFFLSIDDCAIYDIVVAVESMLPVLCSGAI